MVGKPKSQKEKRTERRCERVRENLQTGRICQSSVADPGCFLIFIHPDLESNNSNKRGWGKFLLIYLFEHGKKKNLS
jgi:hypothetical protein